MNTIEIKKIKIAPLTFKHLFPLHFEYLPPYIYGICRTSLRFRQPNIQGYDSLDRILQSCERVSYYLEEFSHFYCKVPSGIKAILVSLLSRIH